MANYSIAGRRNTDPYYDINQIYNLKGQWQTATDPEERNKIAKRAQQFYSSLRQNGHGDVADQLTGSNYEQSKYIKDMYAQLGKTATRPYLKTLGKRYGMSDNDIDNLITYNNDTGEVGFAGQNLGKPDSVHNGVSYWGDTSRLDNAFATYAKNAGLKEPLDLKWNDTLDMATTALQPVNDSTAKSRNNTNAAEEQALAAQAYFNNEAKTPTASSDDYRRVWKDVMPYYSYESDKAGYNAAANGASTNGGNIDSFAAANARRQREASLAHGQQLAAQLGIAARQTTMDNLNRGARGSESLSSTFAENAVKGGQAADYIANAYNRLLGATTDEMSEQANRELTRANSELSLANARNVDAKTLDTYGQLTGMIPLGAYHKIVPSLVNADGTFTDKIHSVDLDAQINQLKANNKNGENDAAIRLLGQLRYYKGVSFPELYGEFLGHGNMAEPTYGGYAQDEAERELERNLEDKRNNTSITIAGMNNEAKQKETDANNAAALKEAEMKNQNVLDQITAQTNADIEKAKQLGLTYDASTGDFTTGEVTSGTTVKDSDIKSIVSEINKLIGTKDSSGNNIGSAIVGGVNTGYSINHSKSEVARIIASSDLTPEQKQYLYDTFGLSSDELNKIANAADAVGNGGFLRNTFDVVGGK